MAIVFKPSSAELSIRSAFAEPAFALFRDPVALQLRFFSEMSKYGLRTSDVRYEAGSGTLSDVVWTYHLTNLHLTAKLRLDRIELHCPDLIRVDVGDVEQSVSRILGLIANKETGIGVITHTYTVAMHTSLENTSAREFVSRLVGFQPDFGTNLGNAVVYYYGPSGLRQGMTITFDQSVRVKGGLFARVETVWDGTGLATSELPSRAASQLKQVLSTFDLTRA